MKKRALIVSADGPTRLDTQFKKPDRPKLIKKEQEFDHHIAPRDSSFNRYNGDLSKLGVKFGESISKKGCPDFSYDQDDITAQIEKWESMKPVYVVNTVFMFVENNLRYGVTLHKKAGASIGQVIPVGLKEMEIMIELFIELIFPDIINADWEKERNLLKSEFKPCSLEEEILVATWDFKKLGHMPDRVYKKEEFDPPNASRVCNCKCNRKGTPAITRTDCMIRVVFKYM